jgi:hypothetical protein
MSIHNLYRAAIVAAALFFVAGCGSAPSQSASTGCSRNYTSGAACATVQVRAAD